jgi:hypothetical protein
MRAVPGTLKSNGGKGGVCNEIEKPAVWLLSKTTFTHRDTHPLKNLAVVK